MISVCFALLLLATTTVAGTLAYETWTAEQYADQSGKNIEVQLVQQQRTYDDAGNVIGLEQFQNNKQLIPLVESAQYDGTNFDKYGMPLAEGYIDQIVRVKNTGDDTAYVRIVVGIPAALDNANDAGLNVLHWNLGNRFMPNGTFNAQNAVNSDYKNVSWTFSETAMVKGIECNIYIFTYQDPLEVNQTTDAAAFVGFYLDERVNVVDGRVLLDGMDTGFSDDEVKIYVKAQAVQSYGFESAKDAFNAEASISTNPWKSETLSY